MRLARGLADSKCIVHSSSMQFARDALPYWIQVRLQEMGLHKRHRELHCIRSDPLDKGIEAAQSGLHAGLHLLGEGDPLQLERRRNESTLPVTWSRIDLDSARRNSSSTKTKEIRQLGTARASQQLGSYPR
jgi:hypothetical protein